MATDKFTLPILEAVEARMSGNENLELMSVISAGQEVLQDSAYECSESCYGYDYSSPAHESFLQAMSDVDCKSERYKREGIALTSLINVRYDNDAHVLHCGFGDLKHLEKWLHQDA